jgi:hypothetical protein
MTDELRHKIYEYFDNNGIAGYHLSSVSFTLDLNEQHFSKAREKRLFRPKLSKFNLTEDEADQIVLDYVYHTTNVKIQSTNDLINMRSIEGKPFFLLLNEHERDKLKYCLAFGKIPGSVIFRNTDKIETLGNITEICGDLGFSDSDVKDLGNLKRIEGSFWISQSGSTFTKLTSLQNIEYIGKDLHIKNSNISNLGNLKRVGGNLNLRESLVTDLGNVEYIVGNLLLPIELKGIIKTDKTVVQGKIKYFNDRSLKEII